MPSKILYSVIIPTYNRGEKLKNTLVPVCSQTISPNQYEIIVVDDESSDNTKDIVEEVKKEFPEHSIIYKRIKHGGPSKARNEGIKISKGEILFFTDDDCIVPNNWIETLLGGYRRHPEAVGVGGWQIPYPKVLLSNKIEQYSLFYTFNLRPKEFVLGHYGGEVCSSCDLPIGNKIGNNAGNTGNMSYKRWVFDLVGYFDEEIYFPQMDDWEFRIRVLRYGYPLVYIALFVLHDKSMSLKSFIRRSFLHGRGRHYVAKKHAHYMLYFGIKQIRLTFETFLKKRGLFFATLYILETFSRLAGWHFESIRNYYKKLLKVNFS
jgi:glycosyltransferase involved in cell wall biosynthesis